MKKGSNPGPPEGVRPKAPPCPFPAPMAVCRPQSQAKMTYEEMLLRLEGLIVDAQKPTELKRGSVYALRTVNPLEASAHDMLSKYLAGIKETLDIEFVVIPSVCELVAPPHQA